MVASCKRVSLKFIRFSQKKTKVWYFSSRGIRIQIYFFHAGSLDGIEMLTFLEISKRLNFTWELREPVDENKWGSLENGTWTGGVFGQLANRTSDVAFCALWITEQQSKYADFTVPWNQVCNTFLVPKPRRKHSWHAVFNSLHGYVWVLVGLSVLFTSWVTCFITKLQLTFQPTSVYKSKYKQLW